MTVFSDATMKILHWYIATASTFQTNNRSYGYRVDYDNVGKATVQAEFHEGDCFFEKIKISY